MGDKLLSAKDLPATEETFWLWLDLFGGARLDELPPGIVVDDWVCLADNNRVTTLPERLTAPGIEVVRCPCFTHITRGVKVDSVLTVEGCPSFECLSPNTSAEWIVIEDCKSFRHLPASCHCYQLTISNCPKLEMLPAVFSPTRIVVQDCPNLKTLPENLNVEHLELVNCKGLESLPPGMSGKNVHIVNCPNVRRLPDDMEFGYIGVDEKFTGHVPKHLEKIVTRLEP